MKHTITIYKGEDFISRKEFESFDKAMAYLKDCEKLNEKWNVHYVRKAV